MGPGNTGLTTLGCHSRSSVTPRQDLTRCPTLSLFLCGHSGSQNPIARPWRNAFSKLYESVVCRESHPWYSGGAFLHRDADYRPRACDKQGTQRGCNHSRIIATDRKHTWKGVTSLWKAESGLPYFTPPSSGVLSMNFPDALISNHCFEFTNLVIVWLLLLLFWPLFGR